MSDGTGGRDQERRRSSQTVVKRLFWVAVLVGTALAAAGVVEAAYVFAPLLGLGIWRVGIASFASLRNGAGHIPTGLPEPLDTRDVRIVYACGGCGAEVLLLVRGTETAPRHCGEKMSEHREVARSPTTRWPPGGVDPSAPRN